MRPTQAILLGIAAATLLVAAGATTASAQPDISDSFDLQEDDGFTGVCDAPCFVVRKSVDVFLAGNNTGPIACAAGENLFVYTLEHLGSPPSTLPAPGIPITEFEVEVDFSLVGSAGFIPGAGIAPTGIVVSPLNAVSFTFPDSTLCPGCLDQGKISEQLYICSNGDPAVRPDTISTTAILLDVQGECLVPVEPAACSIDIDKKCCVARGDDDESSDSDSDSDETLTDECADFDDDSDSGSDSGSDSDDSDDGGNPFLDACNAQAGETVIYQYVISNPNTEKLINVSIEDDQIGTIVSGKRLKPGKNKVFLASDVLYSTTTNTATVTGELKKSGTSCVGADSVTTTIP